MAEYGHCVFDVTLDFKDGAPVVGVNTPRWWRSWRNRLCRASATRRAWRRVCIRSILRRLLRIWTPLQARRRRRLVYIMVPKVESVDVLRAEDALLAAGAWRCRKCAD